MDLSANTRLKTLVLSIPQLPKLYANLTKSITSPNLRTLEYNIVKSNTDFGPLAIVLQRPVFAELDVLAFNCDIPPEMLEDDDAVDEFTEKCRANVIKYIPEFRNRHGHDILKFGREPTFKLGYPFDPDIPWYRERTESPDPPIRIDSPYRGSDIEYDDSDDDEDEDEGNDEEEDEDDDEDEEEDANDMEDSDEEYDDNED